MSGSTTTTKSLFDVGKLDEELQRILEADDGSNCVDLPEPEPLIDDVHEHVKMAQLFAEHIPDENPQATARRNQKLATLDEREQQKRKNDEREGEKKALEEQIYYLYEGTFTRPEIKKLLRDHHYAKDLVLDKLADMQLAKLELHEAYSNSTSAEIKTVYSPQVTIVFKRDDSKPNSPILNKPVPSLDEVIASAIRLAEEFRRRAEHHNQSAIKYGPKDLRSGALTAIAREEKKQAERYLNDADKTKALQVKDSIDLHGFTIERAVSYVNLCIESIRNRRNWQHKLTVITGQGRNNPTGKPILKMGVLAFLGKMNIQYECPSENAGVVIVKL